MQQEFIVNYFTLGLFLIVSILFIPAIIFLTKFLAPHNPTDEKLITYECGVPPRGGIFSHFYIRYYIFAFIFLILDFEAIFLFPWAVNFRALGIEGMIGVFIFIFILILGLIYVWRKGILKWVT
jgi:NADH-quinone oxidoreductase subunit A